jgi:hypothetical protein
MLKTPREHLPEGFPLPSEEESRKFERIWHRAFEIHAAAHDFDAVRSWRNKDGVTEHDGPREGILDAIEGGPHYCDCYERAYREFKQIYEETKGVFERDLWVPALVLDARRRIQL